jgi:hypothetical protein
MSPEIKKYMAEKHADRPEIVEDYLCIGPNGANRFMLIVSPEQRTAPLIDPRSSYENKLCDSIYQDAKHTIEDITVNEAMYGEFDNDIDIITHPHDLLTVRTVKLSLETLSGTVASFSRLQKMMKELNRDNALDEKYISLVQGLVSKVGDARQRMISPDLFPVTRELHCFYDRAFNGIYCLRNHGRRGDTRTLFVSTQNDVCHDVGEKILCFDKIDQSLFDVLCEKEYVSYNPDLLGKGIRELEDEMLLNADIDIAALNNSSLISQIRKRLLPDAKSPHIPLWQELRGINRKLETGSKFKELMKDTSYEAQLKLIEATKKPEVVNHLLAELDPSDVVRSYQTHPQRFAAKFDNLSVNRKKYIVHVLTKHQEKSA